MSESLQPSCRASSTRRMRRAACWLVASVAWAPWGCHWANGPALADSPFTTSPSTLADGEGPVVRGQSGDKDEGFLGRYAPKKLMQSAKVAAGYGPDKAIADKAFAEGEALFVAASKSKGKERTEKFSDAAKKYETAYKRWPDSTLEEDSLFMLSESCFFADRYPQAAKTYEILVKKYPYTRHMDTVDRRRFALAKYWIDHSEANPDWPMTPNFVDKDRPLFDKFGHAVRVLDKIRMDDPTSTFADDATMEAALANFNKGNFQRADEMFADLRQTFPNSKHQFQAHLLGLQCKLKIYQGPQYSVTPMDEAETLIKQIHRQFPQESQEYREYLEKAWQEVRLKKAQHDWETARYYHKRNENAAARQYYDQVKKDFRDTSLAQDAAENLSELSDKPDKPAQPLPWLSKMFPTPERQKPLVARNPLRDTKR